MTFFLRKPQVLPKCMSTAPKLFNIQHASTQEDNYSTIHLRNDTSVLNFLPQWASDGQM